MSCALQCSHCAEQSVERVYVIRLGSFNGDGPYIRAMDDLDDWTITFVQRRAMRFASLAAAEFTASEFGDARPVRLRPRPPQAHHDPKGTDK